MDIDVGIITVLNDCELPALKQVFRVPPHKPPFQPTQGEAYHFADVYASAARRPLRVAIVSSEEAGNAQCSDVTRALIDRFHPELVLLVGIAAGSAAKTRLGDVVLSRSVFFYEPGKLQEHGFQPRMRQPEVGYWLWAQAHRMACDTTQPVHQDLVQLVSSEQSCKSESPRTHATGPSIHSAVIASGEKVFEDGGLETLRTRYNDRILAGDMESAGLVIASERTATPWLVIRGVSDHGDPKTRSGRYKDSYHGTASHSAATFAYAFLRHAYSNSPIPSEFRGLDDAFASLAPLKIRAVMLSAGGDKAALDTLGMFFQEQHIRMIATPGTARHLELAGADVLSTYEFTNTEQIGRTRGTMHPHILAAIQASDADDDARTELHDHGLESINLIVVNSPSEDLGQEVSARDALQTLSRVQAGGPALLRWGVRHWASCAVVVDPRDYSALVQHLKAHDLYLQAPLRRQLFRNALRYLDDLDRRAARLFARLFSL